MERQIERTLAVIGFFKKILTPKQLSYLRSFISWISRLVSPFYARNLKMLALIHGSNKWGKHWYAQHYENHFAHVRKKKLNILEIGAGGYASPTKGGASLRMWKYYFPKSVIYSVDIYDKSLIQEKRIKIFKGNQADVTFLMDVFKEVGSLDIIIDDGSHFNEHVLTSFEVLFPLLNERGIYVIEDVQMSYWPKFGGDSENLNNPRTMMNFLKNLTDCLNHKEFIRPGYLPTYFDQNIVSIHFYHNIVFIYKGRNKEESIFIKDNDTDKEWIK